MTSLTYAKRNIEDLKPFKRAFLNSVADPIDGMWETFADMACHYAIIINGNAVGYFAISDEQKLMQFYLPDTSGKRSFFSDIVEALNIKGAFVSTAEPAYLSLCLDRQKTVTVNALMYQAENTSPIEEPVFPDGCTFRLVSQPEHDIAVAFGMSAFEADEAWLRDYYRHHIMQEQLYGLWRDNKMIAAGELRCSATQKPFADVGMVVSPDHRGKGIATNILLKLRRLARENSLTAICSTERDNIAAQRAISKAGFISKHRVLDITF